LVRKAEFPNPKIELWVYKLQDYQYDLIHTTGKNNSEADILSRQILYMTAFNPVDNYDLPQSRTKLIGNVFRFLILQQNLNDLDAQQMRQIRNHARNYRFSGQTLFRKRSGRWVQVPTLTERHAILKEAHDGRGHFGKRATFQYINERYWWPNFYLDCAHYVDACLPCQQFDKRTVNYAPRFTEITQLFEKWAVDYIGPLPTTAAGNSYIIVCVEYFTKWPLAMATTSADARTSAKFLFDHVICVFGPPKQMICDNGTHFHNSVMEELFLLLKSDLHYAAAEKPSTVGEAERFIKTLSEALERMAHLDRLTWDTFIHPALYAYRSRINSVTKHTPQELVFGMSVRTVDSLVHFGETLGAVPHDTMKQTRAKVQALYDSRPEFYSYLKRNLRELPQFAVGDNVLLFKGTPGSVQFRKFHKRWLGPFQVSRKLPNNNYMLIACDTLVQRKNPIHASRLKSFVASSPSSSRGSVVTSTSISPSTGSTMGKDHSEIQPRPES
jgi:hypothetical protein